MAGDAAYYAHSAAERPESEWHRLDCHLRAVARKAGILAHAFGGQQEAEMAGVLHDVGKLRDEFQSYLRKERGPGPDTHHAVYGARYAFDRDWLGPPH